MAPRSTSSDGQRFWLAATRPSYSSCWVARMSGWVRAPVSSCTRALGSSAPAPTMPRGRWYLKLRPTRRTPLAINAEASVSPWNPA
jgi:hypothetical protein